MSTSAFSSARGRSSPASGAAHTAPATAPQETAAPSDPTCREGPGDWLGSKGEQLRVRVVVEEVMRGSHGLRTYRARTLDAGDAVEWSSQRRHGIRAGDRLALSGLVKTHTARDDVRITVLRDCFNPLRMAS